MITVLINQPKFEYDIHSLVKAFYTTEEVKVVLNDSAVKPEGRVFYVEYLEDAFAFYDGERQELNRLSSVECKDRTDEKNLVKRLVYQALSLLTGKVLAWGDLTGIRPTKIARKLLDKDATEQEILDYMQSTYLVGDEKAHLAIDIAKREKQIVSCLNCEKGYSIYIGIPFCPTTCLYCSFTSNSIGMWRKRVDEYLDALIKEIEYVGIARKDKVIDTIYIGGGTPTTLEPEHLERLLSAIESNLDLSHIVEYTVEAGRPDSITEDKLKVLKHHGVSRISVNPQTMNQKTLDIIGRRHTVEQVEEAFKLARKVGFDNINMDIILGLPGEGEAEVKETVERIMLLSPDSLTVHSLAIKRASALSEWIAKNGYETMINTEKTMEMAEKAARDMGMQPYYLYRQKNMAGNFENTGYAREGCYGIYNILIMEELEPIVALGPGSVSKVITKDGQLVRSDNVKDVALYIENIDEMIKRKEELFSLE